MESERNELIQEMDKMKEKNEELHNKISKMEENLGDERSNYATIQKELKKYVCFIAVA